MAVRDLREMGTNLQKIFNRLLKNNDLLKLLYYTDKDPLGQNDLTENQIKEEVFNKLIKVILCILCGKVIINILYQG